MLTEQSPLSYVRDNILSLEPYSTARDEFKGGDISVWIDANENPFNNGVNRYPDPHHRLLKQHISQLKHVREDQLFIGGAGSDEAIDLTYRIFCEPRRDNAIAITPSYGVYSVSAAVNDVELREVQLSTGFSLPVDQLLAAADNHSKLMWICSPNNPTGNAFSHRDIVRLCQEFDGMVVVDEAYVDFSSVPSMLSEIGNHANLIVLQTFSKAWGMAGLRVGMAISDPRIAELYERVKYPYNINGPTQQAIIDRIATTDLHAMVSTILSERRRLETELVKLPCVLRVYPSDANFLLVKMTDADSAYNYLIEHGVIVRNRSKLPGCKSTLRITVGTPDENTRTLEVLREYGA